MRVSDIRVGVTVSIIAYGKSLASPRDPFDYSNLIACDRSANNSRIDLEVRYYSHIFLHETVPLLVWRLKKNDCRVMNCNFIHAWKARF